MCDYDIREQEIIQMKQNALVTSVVCGFIIGFAIGAMFGFVTLI